MDVARCRPKKRELTKYCCILQDAPQEANRAKHTLFQNDVLDTAKHPPANRAKHTLFKPMYWILLNIHQCGSSRCIIKLIKIFLSRRWSKEGNKNDFYKHSTSEV
jgi:hypothetical protein